MVALLKSFFTPEAERFLESSSKEKASRSCCIRVHSSSKPKCTTLLKTQEQIQYLYEKVKGWKLKSEVRENRTKLFIKGEVGVAGGIDDDFGDLRIEEILEDGFGTSPLSNYSFIARHVASDLLSMIKNTPTFSEYIAVAAYDKKQNLQGVATVILKETFDRSGKKGFYIFLDGLISAYGNMNFNQPNNKRRAKKVGSSLIVKILELRKDISEIKVTPSQLAVPFYTKLGFTQIALEGTEEFPVYKLSKEKFPSILENQSDEFEFIVSRV